MKKVVKALVDNNMLMKLREIFHSSKDTCVVVPDNVLLEDLFGNYYLAISTRLRTEGVRVINYGNLTQKDLEYEKIIDLSDMI